MTNYTKDQITAFRLEAHHLSTRLPPASLVQAAGACSIQNTPPGSADLALHARVADLKPGDLEQALISKKSLLQAWSMRASPYIFPTRDAAVFLTGLLPQSEDEIRFFIRGVEPALEIIGMRAVEAVEFASTGLLEELDNCLRTKDELGVSIARRISEYLNNSQLESWMLPSFYAKGQTLGESVVRFVLPVLSLMGLVCHADRKGNKAYLARTGHWLGKELSQVNKEKQSVELFRRYMHCFGPSTVEHFAEWAGISPDQAGRTWNNVKDEYVEIRFEEQSRWLHHDDVLVMDSAREPRGIRLLPPHDPYLQLRDREMIVPDKTLQRSVWRTSGNPGVVLIGGKVVGMWNPQKKGSRLDLKVQMFEEISSQNRSLIDDEGKSLAQFRGCNSAEVKVEN